MKNKRSNKPETNEYRSIVPEILFAVAFAFQLSLPGCSSDDDKNVDEPIETSGGAGESASTVTSGVNGATVQADTGSVGVETPIDSSVGDGSLTPDNAGSGGQAGPVTVDAGPQLDAAEDAGPMVDAAEDSGLEPDCTPSAWVDPGTVPNPEVVKIDPTAGTMGKPWGWTPAEALAEFGYVEEEWLIKGTTPTPYTSRILVRRPEDPAKFTGTVFMEWYNVSGMIDFDPLWNYSWEYFMREGHVEVSVSAQAIGANALTTNDPERYAEINHPGDSAANAIFSQAAMAIRAQSELILGECMPVDAVIGMGQSQSSMRLSAYINDAGPTAKIYDGYITHTGMEPASNNPHAPTFVVFSMTEGNGALEDGPNMVEWVVAGATHTDEFTTTRGARAAADLGMDVATLNQCVYPMNQYPSWRVYNALNDWMHRWVRNGERPPSQPRLQGNGGFFIGGWDTDEHGNVLGGVRLPELEVPIASYTNGNSAVGGQDFIAGMACGLGGATEKFSAEKLLQLYPTHDDYVQKYTTAAEQAVADGVLLEEDAEAAIEAAKNAPIPN